MFQLFKRRDFGDYISDTFQFFRQNGKHFFGIYFTISGIPLMIMLVITYFVFQVYFDFFLRTGQDRQPNFDLLSSYFTNNVGLIIFVGFFIILFGIFMSILSYSVPVIYFDLLSKNKEKGFGVKEVVNVLKANFGRTLIFFLGIVFIVTPLMIVVFALLVLLCFIIIGFPLLLFAIPTVFSWIILSYYEYFNYKKGFFESLGEGFSKMKSQYFPIVGSLMVIYIIIQVVMTIFSMIPYMFGIFSMMTSLEQNPTGENDPFSTFRIMMTIVMVISMIMSYILNNLMMVNQGLVHYSRRENDENVSSNDSIDMIGSE